MRGCPILEKLGWIRIMMERAVILCETPPPPAQLSTLTDWFEECEQKLINFQLVYPGGVEQETINPEEFEDFKIVNYCKGQINKWYAEHKMG